MTREEEIERIVEAAMADGCADKSCIDRTRLNAILDAREATIRAERDKHWDDIINNPVDGLLVQHRADEREKVIEEAIAICARLGRITEYIPMADGMLACEHALRAKLASRLKQEQGE